MVASQSSGEPAHNDMYCSAVPTPYGEYYPTAENGGHYYIHQPHHPQELCPQHHSQQMCAVHGDYGPVTVPMVSTTSSSPIAMPVQVPPGHMLQQIVDESGTVRHVILSPQPMVPIPPPSHGHNSQHYGPGPGNGSNHQSQQPFFPQGLPPGYGPPHFTMPPSTHLGHTPAAGSHAGHSPPPNFHKDERTHRQYIKLKKKLEQKQMRGNGDALMVGNLWQSEHSAPTLSSRKVLVNGLRRGAAAVICKERGMSSVGTSEDGEESSSIHDDEDEIQTITDILSSVQAPQVLELSSRSALIEWSIPQRLSEVASNGSHDIDITESDLRYEVLLSTDKGKEGKYKSIYSGSSLSCRIQDLRPGQEYSVCLQVHCDDLKGNASDPLTFVTPACEPDQPQPPKLISRTRTSLQLRWNAATDNGSHILYYILEYDEGKGSKFVELSKGKGKQYNLQKLQTATTYKFRLSCVNECGKSAHSDIVAFSTNGTPPVPPAPPLLEEASITTLHLKWLKRPVDDGFTLQMYDKRYQHGFLPVFDGKETEYVCSGLRRATDYRFRLRSQNDEGISQWSEDVCYRTLPDRPSQPFKPNVKGKIHAHQFKIKWDPPSDTGGSDITAYVLQINSGSGYETVYRGTDTEAICDRLSPGTTYQLRVNCKSSGGVSEYSDPCTVTTEAVCPSRCQPPKVLGKPRANSISMRWNHPEFNGGSNVTDFELEVINPDSTRRLAYKGKDTECNVMDLSPGQVYNFVLRALNRVGAGAWSEELVVTSGASIPDAPQAPEVIPKSPFHVFVQWKEPFCNGAPITEYRLEIGSTDQNENFSSIFQGGSSSYDVKGLSPFTTYYFRVQACNIAGCSSFSPIIATMTPASAPNAMSVPKFTSTPTSITLTWQEPTNNGADILYYNIELGDKGFSTETAVNKFTLENLHPDTLYKIKIQAVNAVGSGPLSPVCKASTLPIPPKAPNLECICTGHNYLKLKWGEGKNLDFTTFCLEMYQPRFKEYQCIYQGTNYTYKVNKLQELTAYKFRISAANDFAGEGEFSSVYEFTTCIAFPVGLKSPKIADITQRSCCLEWGACRVTGGDSVIYLMQVTRAKDQDYKQVYKGPETKCVLNDLEPGTEYMCRVCPIRLTCTGELQGPFSPVCTLSTLPPDPVQGQRTTVPSVTNSPVRHRRNQKFFSWLTSLHGTENRPMSDKQRALLILIIFTIISIFSAVLVEKFINWRQSV